MANALITTTKRYSTPDGKQFDTVEEAEAWLLCQGNAERIKRWAEGLDMGNPGVTCDGHMQGDTYVLAADLPKFLLANRLKIVDMLNATPNESVGDI